MAADAPKWADADGHHCEGRRHYRKCANGGDIRPATTGVHVEDTFDSRHRDSYAYRSTPPRETAQRAPMVTVNVPTRAYVGPPETENCPQLRRLTVPAERAHPRALTQGRLFLGGRAISTAVTVVSFTTASANSASASHPTRL